MNKVSEMVEDVVQVSDVVEKKSKMLRDVAQEIMNVTDSYKKEMEEQNDEGEKDGLRRELNDCIVEIMKGFDVKEFVSEGLAINFTEADENLQQRADFDGAIMLGKPEILFPAKNKELSISSHLDIENIEPLGMTSWYSMNVGKIADSSMKKNSTFSIAFKKNVVEKARKFKALLVEVIRMSVVDVRGSSPNSFPSQKSLRIFLLTSDKKSPLTVPDVYGYSKRLYKNVQNLMSIENQRLKRLKEIVQKKEEDTDVLAMISRAVEDERVNGEIKKDWIRISVSNFGMKMVIFDWNKEKREFSIEKIEEELIEMEKVERIYVDIAFNFRTKEEEMMILSLEEETGVPGVYSFLWIPNVIDAKIEVTNTSNNNMTRDVIEFLKEAVPKEDEEDEGIITKNRVRHVVVKSIKKYSNISHMTNGNGARVFQEGMFDNKEKTLQMLYLLVERLKELKAMGDYSKRLEMTLTNFYNGKICSGDKFVEIFNKISSEKIKMKQLSSVCLLKKKDVMLLLESMTYATLMMMNGETKTFSVLEEYMMNVLCYGFNGNEMRLGVSNMLKMKELFDRNRNNIKMFSNLLTSDETFRNRDEGNWVSFVGEEAICQMMREWQNQLESSWMEDFTRDVDDKLDMCGMMFAEIIKRLTIYKVSKIKSLISKKSEEQQWVVSELLKIEQTYSLYKKEEVEFIKENVNGEIQLSEEKVGVEVLIAKWLSFPEKSGAIEQCYSNLIKSFKQLVKRDLRLVTWKQKINLFQKIGWTFKNEREPIYCLAPKMSYMEERHKHIGYLFKNAFLFVRIDFSPKIKLSLNQALEHELFGNFQDQEGDRNCRGVIAFTEEYRENARRVRERDVNEWHEDQEEVPPVNFKRSEKLIEYDPHHILTFQRQVVRRPPLKLNPSQRRVKNTRANPQKKIR